MIEQQVDAEVLSANDRGKFLVLAMPLQSLMRRQGFDGCPCRPCLPRSPTKMTQSEASLHYILATRNPLCCAGTWEMLQGVGATLSRDPMVFAWIHPSKQVRVSQRLHINTTKIPSTPTTATTNILLVFVLRCGFVCCICRFCFIYKLLQNQLATLLLKDFVHPIKRSLDPLDPERKLGLTQGCKVYPPDI